MRKNKLFEGYLKEIYQRISKGDAREESFYSALEKLISAYGQSIGKKTDVTVLPKKSEAGNPDFRVWDGQSKITGYIEAKPPTKHFLDEVEASEQLERYLEAYPNVILTNFLEFRLYREGILWDKPVKISDFSLAQKIAQFPVVQHEEKLAKLLTFFFDFTQPRITHPKTLAEVLAYKAGIMRDYIVLPTIQENEDNYFSWLYQSFQEHLIKDLEKRDFADLFSQTFTYGLFIAKYQYEVQQTLFGKTVSTLPLTTKTAYDFIQKSFGILREVFKIISTQEMPKDLKIIVDDIVDILNHTDVYKLLSKTSRSGKKDPIFHLYETFLLKYDKERKKKLGVFYTPLEVVSYIVNSVHTLLKDNKLFDASDGLASYKSDSLEKSVTLLDPAVGTGTFFVNAIEKAVEEIKSRYSSSPNYVSDFIRSHILPHFFAFEILIAPYVVNHLKVLFSLTEKGFEFKNSDSLKIFLTNTLEFHPKDSKESYSAGIFERVLVTEQEKALEVKNKTPILVIIGNPPYSVSSQNKVAPETPFGKFYESYKEKVRKEEKNIQPLSDDYIKFLAFAHWKVKTTGKGIVGMITNNSYLDGLIHRDMREKILEDFDLVYILNLHGDAKRPKATADGKKDENVFDIRQGVAISLFVKPENSVKKQVYYQELIGPRKSKYKYLETHNVKTSKWTRLTPKKPYWFLVPRESESEEYDGFVPLTDVFSKNSVGVVSGCDSLLVDSNKGSLRRQLQSLLSKDLKSLVIDSVEGKQKRKISDATKEKLSSLQEIKDSKIIPYAYRPFDNRYTYFDKLIIQRLRSPFSDNMLKTNLSINTTRQLLSLPFRHAFISQSVSDKCFVSLKSREATYFFPLWIYDGELQNTNQKSLLGNNQVNKGKKINIKNQVISWLSSSFNKKVLPEDVFYYIYAILYSDIYRQKYEEFLKIDFPKIPFTKNYELFRQLSKLGKELAGLHLLKSPLLNKTSSKFEGKNGGFVKKPYYEEKEKKVYINKGQYFTNVSPKVWNYYVGSYQVLHKWLKDRKGKALSSEEVNHYIRIILALKETMTIQQKIDKLYVKVEKSLI